MSRGDCGMRSPSAAAGARTGCRTLRPGMDLWQILVLGVLKQGLGCDFDRLHELTNHHDTIRAFLGHSDFGDKTQYEYQTVVDNVSLLTPELLSAVGRLVVESGHKVKKKRAWRAITRAV